MVYVAFIIDVCARPAEPGLIHHGIRSEHHVSVSYAERLAEAGIWNGRARQYRFS